MRFLKTPLFCMTAFIAISLPTLAGAEEPAVNCMAMPVCPTGTTTVANCEGKTDCEASSMCGHTIYCVANSTDGSKVVEKPDTPKTPVVTSPESNPTPEKVDAPKTMPESTPETQGHVKHGKCKGHHGKCKGHGKHQGKCQGKHGKCEHGKHGYHHGMAPDKYVMGAAETPLFQWHVYLNNEIYTANNRDFLEENNETFIDSFDTDDRFTIGKSSISLDVSYQISDTITLNAEPTYRSVWGGSTGSGVYLRKMNVDWTIFEKGDIKISTKIGPQPFTIGGSDKDFFFNDIATGATLTADLGKGGRLRLLPFDISALADPRKSSYSSFKTVKDSRGGGTAKNFSGDTFTYRMGGVYELAELVKGLEFRAFGFFANIGTGKAPHTGSDRSFHGSHANFSDKDYNWMGGARAGYQLNGDKLSLHVFGEYARSGGIDRKAIQIGVRDIKTDGNAFGLGIRPELNLGMVKPHMNLRFFMADGGSHTGAEGLAFNYGFVGFNGDQVGGHTIRKGSGWRPSTVLSDKGVTYSPNNFDRQAGTMVITAEVGATLMEKLTIDAGVWFYKDTSSTGIEDFGNLSKIAEELPFGYTEADLESQERFGKILGIELDGKLGYIAKKDVLNLFIGGGLFLPGDFYKIKISRTGGTALGAENPVSFWAASGGATLSF